ALLRHGAAWRRPRSARLARQPVLVQHVGAAAAALVLPVRLDRRRVGARELRAARQALTSGAMTKGYSSPRSPEGRSSLVPYPPWHYVGDFLVIEYWAEPAAVHAVLPAGLEPHPAPRRCDAILADWQSSSEGGDELTDPSRSQYREFFLVVNALLDGEEVTHCPYIWVDRDFALARGWLQGFPKKLGSVWITRRFGLDCSADPGLRPGAVYGGTCGAYDRRLAEGTGTLERLSADGPTPNDPPLLNRRPLAPATAG